VVIAGDLFDKPNAPPELIRFAFKYLPREVYAVPGNHDLPFHRYADMHKSAYGVLVQAERIENLEPGQCRTFVPKHSNARAVTLYGFPWGSGITPPDGKPKEVFDGENYRPGMHVAVVHDYCWIEGRTYDGYDYKEGRFHHALSWSENLAGYRTAIYGDNHIPFTYGHIRQAGPITIYNCGTFIRRKQDERHLRPGVGLVRADGSVDRIEFDTSKDKFVDAEDTAADVSGVAGEFVRELREAAAEGVDFVESLLRRVKQPDVRKAVRRVVLEAVQKLNEER
jgi:DNA repair exonuclease SbcCD nuclease subunit